MNKNFKDNSGGWHVFLLTWYQGKVLCIFAIVAAITLYFIFLTPILLLLHFFLARKMKTYYQESYDYAVSEFKAAGHTVTNEIKNPRINILIDMEKKKICYWWIGLKDFQPGIADFSEIQSVDFRKDNDIAVADATGRINKRKKGDMRMVINFNRFDEPTFDFPIFNQYEAGETLQKLTLLMEAGRAN